MIDCKKMCYERLEWGVFEADTNDEELNIYGNNISVEGSAKFKLNLGDKYKEQDVMVRILLEDFDNIYNTEVVKPIKEAQARKENRDSEIYG